MAAAMAVALSMHICMPVYAEAMSGAQPDASQNQLLFLVAGITTAYSLYLLSIIFSVFMLFPVERNRNKATRAND